MATKTVLEMNDLAFPIKLEQSGPDNFTVTYGAQVKSWLNYERAAREFGECIFHALACDGRLDNSEAE